MFVLDWSILNLQACAKQNAFNLYKPSCGCEEGKKIPELRHLVTTEQDISFTHGMINGTRQMLCVTALCVCRHTLICSETYAVMLMVCLYISNV